MKAKNNEILITLIAVILTFSVCSAQTTDSLDSRHLYRPRNVVKEKYEPSNKVGQTSYQETMGSMQGVDSLMNDSLIARQQFIQDSLLAREAFVKDSLRRRQQIIDSLKFLQVQLPRLIKAALYASSDDMIYDHSKIEMVGDSTLSNFEYRLLPYALNEPYTPWKGIVNLSDDPIPIQQNSVNHRIESIQAPFLTCTFKQSSGVQVLVMYEKSSIVSKREGKFYKEPIDSVFFDRYGRVAKIKKYIQLYSVNSSYQRGNKLLLHLSQVKFYTYTKGSQLSSYSVVNYCDRWKRADAIKVCNSVKYSLEKQSNQLLVKTKRSPKNNYADGTFTYEFDTLGNLKSIAFKNLANTEDRKTVIELNDDGNVYRYIFYNKDQDPKTWVFNYHNEPNAKYKVETISCTFEDDGVSYYQNNLTTGKARIRNKLTMEWGPWQ